jgi:hypothetical protein
VGRRKLRLIQNQTLESIVEQNKIPSVSALQIKKEFWEKLLL